MSASYDFSISVASLDKNDPLSGYRDNFCLPEYIEGRSYLYFCGNSLGLQPKATRQYINQELEDWAQLGVEGHFKARRPWLPYHEFLTEKMAGVVGALTDEVVCMNSLTVNLHLMMVSFYRPQPHRFKILIEGGAFPSDQYAVASQARFHGYNPEDAIIELLPREGEDILRTEDIVAKLEEEGDSVALVMMGGVNYLTGQLYDMAAITVAAHKKGCLVGFDLAHAAGNVPLQLHDWNVDFAVWCSYKYLNAGPGGIAGCFVHRNIDKIDIPRFEGWWGHNKESRFQMPATFSPINSVEAWQLSNPPIFQLAALNASLDIFQEIGMEALRKKSLMLTSYLEHLFLEAFEDRQLIITPEQTQERGAQLSFRIPGASKAIVSGLLNKGVICDFREPNIIRAAPVPLYNSFQDVWEFISILKESCDEW